MKKTTFALIALILAGCSTTRFTTNSTMDNWKTLNGKIKSISKVAYKAVDSAGTLVKGQKLTKTSDGFMQYQGNRSYFFNKKGQRVKGVYQPFVGAKMVFLRQYSRRDKLIKLTAFQDGELQYWQTMQYDRKADKMTMLTYLPDSSVTRHWAFRYNDHGKKIEKSYYDATGKRQIIYRFDYDNQGNRTAKKVHFIGNSQSDFEIICGYDKKGNRTFLKEESGGEAFAKNVYQYNKKGDPILEKCFNGEGELILTVEWTYRYDKKGNWIQKSILKNNNYRLIIAREIAYY